MATTHPFKTAWKGVKPNQGSNSGGCHPVPLRDPYVLWDTRNFVPNNIAHKVGSIFPGPLNNPTRLLNSTTSPFTSYWGVLSNEGASGSKFDLHVYYDPLTGADTDGRLTAIKYYLRTTNNDSLGTEWPLSWDDYEGDPCEAPFTTIYGLGHLGRNQDWALFTEHSWQAEEIYEDMGNIFLDDIDGVTGQLIYGGFGGFYLNNGGNMIEFYPDEADYFGNLFDYNNEIVTITYDPRCRESYVWVGTELFIVEDAGDESDGLIRWEDSFSSGDCRDYAFQDDTTTDDIYIEMFGHDYPYSSDASDYVPGTAWSGVVGIAKFRGSPSKEDLLYWQEYFRADAPFSMAFTETTTAVTDAREMYPNPYRYRYTGAIQTYTVPCGVTNIRITCWGAGRPNDGEGGRGGMAEAEFVVTPGQVFDVYVGGTPSGNNGGWPNGGSPQPGNNNEGEPGYGSSHVIPTGLTMADALVVGGGGGGTNQGPSRNNVAAGVTAGDGGYPAGTDGNGVTGPDNGIEWGGRGGSQVAGGAVGTSTAGSGNGTAGDWNGQGTGGRAAGSGNFFHFAGGSGGGGWHGGGGAGFPRLYGGGSYAGDGGGGSSYTAPSGTNANYVNASVSGPGMVEILALHDPEDIGC